MATPGLCPTTLEPTVDRFRESRRRWRLYSLREIMRQRTARGHEVTQHKNGDVTLHIKRKGVQLQTLSPVAHWGDGESSRGCNAHHRTRRVGPAQKRASAKRAADDERYMKRVQKRRMAATAAATAAADEADDLARAQAAPEAADAEMEQAAPRVQGIKCGVEGKRRVVTLETAAAAETEADKVEEVEPPRRKGAQQAGTAATEATDLAATEAEARVVREELATMKPRRHSGNTATGKGVMRAVKKITGTSVEYMQKIIEKQMTRGEKMGVVTCE